MSGSEDSEGCQDDGNGNLNLAQADTDGGQCVNHCSPQCPPTLMDSDGDNPLNKWCCEQWELSQAQEKKDKEDSIDAARNMIINVLLVLKDPEKSSNDFVKMCNADELKGLKVPTVNDGRQQFFALRDDIYEKYKAIMCFIFESVNVIGVTLDKVTLNKKSYTVIVT